MNSDQIFLAEKLLRYRDQLKSMQMPHTACTINCCIGENSRVFFSLLPRDVEHVLNDALFRCEKDLLELGIELK